jgi:hypothetical protein
MGEYKEQNGRTHVQEDKRTTQEGEPQREHEVLEPPLVIRSISNRKRGGPPERTPSLEKPSPITTSRLKIKIAFTCCNH